jgi:O-antigen/teichoic acid export membrane protein
MTLKKKLISGGIWIGVATIFTSLFSYLFRFLLIKNLPLEDYGLFYAIVPIFLFATTFIDLGRSSAFVKYGSEYLAKGKKNILKFLIKYYFKFKLKTGFIFIIIVFASSSFLAKHYFKDQRAFYLFIALGLIYFLTDIFFNYINILLKTFQNQKKHAIYKVLFNFSQIAFLVLFLVLGFGIWSPVLAFLIGPLIASLIFYYVIYKEHFPEFFKIIEKKSQSLIKSIKVFAYANVFFAIGRYILNYTDTYMLTYFTNLESVGLYNVAVPTARLILFFSVAITFILVPLISTLEVKKDFTTMNKLINMTYKISLLFLLPIALVMIAYPKIILRILYSTEHVAASVPLQFLAISAIFTMLFSINAQILNGIGKAKLNSKNVLFGTIFNVVLNFILIPFYGIGGAAFSTMCGYILMSSLGFYQINKNIKKVKIQKSYFVKLILCAVVFLGSVYLLKSFIIMNVWIESMLVLGISFTLYLLSVFLTKIITVSGIKETIKLYKK